MFGWDKQENYYKNIRPKLIKKMGRFKTIIAEMYFGRGLLNQIEEH